MVFYALQHLTNHCKKLHFICDHCDSVHKDKDALKAHISRQHQPAQPAPTPVPQPAQATATSPLASTEAPEEETQVPSADESAKGTTDPDTSTASDANVHPACPGFICGICKAYCPTNTSFRIHITTHKKTPCLFCPQKFYNIASRNGHIRAKHDDRHDRKLNYRLAPDCEEKFNSLKELGIHSRLIHKSAFPWRCSYKDCFDCFRTIEGLLKHGKTHGKESWDETPTPAGKRSGTSAPSVERCLINLLN